MVSVDSDTIVIGAGPAGSFSALHAAKLGATVTVYEEHGEIGDPVHCTGHVSFAGVKRLKLDLPERAFENKVRAATFYSSSGCKFSIRFSSPVTCVINRKVFDQYIARKAMDEGAEIVRGAHVDSFLIEKGSVKGVVVRKGKKTETSLSKIVIDAEGVCSGLLRRAGLPSLNHRMVVNGVQAEVDRVDGVEDDMVEVFLGKRFAPGFFAWIVPRRDGTAKVGLAAAKGDPHERLRHFIRRHPVACQRLKQSKITGLVYHPVTLGGPISRTFHDGLLVVGDAASQVKPTTGGGIIMGLVCARTAGRTAAYAIRYKDPSASFLSEYERQWKRDVGFDMMVMKRLRLMLNGLTDRQIDKLVAQSSRLGLEKSLKGFGDIDFQGTSLVRMARSPRFLATALYFLITSFF